jgi:cytoskeletal protein CcmA (bactofilin family)
LEAVVAEKRQTNGELSLIGAGTVVEGKVLTEGSIRIDGTMVGDVVAGANAAVGSSGVLEGNLSAKNISLAGKVRGAVMASEKLILESKSVLRGDIRATRLVVDEGAMFDGQCAMSAGDGEESKPSQGA